MSKIAVIGAGSWGTALALTLDYNKHQVRLWSNEADHVAYLKEHKENTPFLPGIKIPDSIFVTGDLAEAVRGAEGLVMVVPSHAVSAVSKKLAGLVPEDTVLISAAKGFDPNTLERMSEILHHNFPENPVVVFSGPSHAEEVCVRKLTTVVSASEDEKMAEWVQQLFSNDFLRVYTNNDVLGVELGGAMKNIIALGCGICYGFGCGDNTEAALLTRGLAEISRLGVAMGAKASTFAGLAGIGDLVVTCGSLHSRNRRAGTMLGQGKSLDYVLENMGMVVEGVNAAKIGYRLAQKYNVEMPITKTIYRILYEGYDINQAFQDLMGRSFKSEKQS
ncbi:MAG: NAD(P)H-dependent glycerol-3-phosphate dehydrogenase [Bacillota bacterium]|jgi:glycerol-3-phosphate dehydrogenase (NAD(P)+)